MKSKAYLRRVEPLETIDSTVSLFRSFDVPRLSQIEPEIFVLRSELPASALAIEATTLGWDTVSAIRLPQVNRTLAAYPPPDPFNYEIQPGWTVAGEFNNWSMVRGGSGAIVFLRTPLKTCKMTFTSQPDLVFNNGWVTIQIKLKYLPQPPAGEVRESSDDGDPQYLARDTEARSEDDPPVVLQAVNYGDGNPDTLQDALFRQAIVEYFKANLELFTYVFTLVNLNARAAEGQFQWLKPTYTSYAYFNGAEDTSSYFGVLNMTENQSADGLTNQITPSAIPNDSNASLLISQERFLTKLVLPGLPLGFTNSTVSDYTLDNNNTTIKNVSTIKMDDIEVDGISYTPYLQEFTFQVVGDECQINSKIKVTVFPGVHVYIRSTAYYTIYLVDKPEGGQTLDFKEARAPKVDHYYEKDIGVIITEIIIGIITAVATVGAGKIIETAIKKIIAIIIIVIVGGLLAAIPTIIAAVLEGKAAEALPPIGFLVTEATGDIEWPESSGLYLLSAQLNGSLVLGGNLEVEPN